MRKIGIIIVALLISFCAVAAHAGEEKIQIIGSPDYQAQVQKALGLLRTKAPDAYQLISDYVGRIQQSQKSGMFAYSNPPTYQMADRTAFYSVTWCAATIAHDACHSKLYNDHKNYQGEPVPNDIWTGLDAEQECLAYQVNVMRQIEAPQAEIDHCASQDGTHYDVNKDGRNDAQDYNLRNW